MIRFLSHPSHPYGGQRVLFLLISRVVISFINKTLSMPNKVCVLTSWFVVCDLLSFAAVNFNFTLSNNKSGGTIDLSWGFYS